MQLISEKRKLIENPTFAERYNVTYFSPEALLSQRDSVTHSSVEILTTGAHMSRRRPVTGWQQIYCHAGLPPSGFIAMRIYRQWQ